MKAVERLKSLRFKLVALGLISVIFADSLPSFAADGKPAFCPYAEGQIIQPLSIKDVYTKINPSKLKKDEFETISNFEDRKEESRKLSRFPFPVLANMNSLHRNQYVQYDADRRVTFIDVRAMLQPSPYFNAVMKQRWQANEAPRYFHAIKLGKLSTPTNIRTVINSAGQSIEVTVDDSQYVHVYMGAKERNFHHLFIGETKRSFGGYESDVVEITMTVDEAQNAKRSLQFVPIIQPRKPYTGWLEYFREAEVDKAGLRGRAVEVDADFPVIFADISCLAITNQKNEILKIVRANRPSLSHSVSVLSNEMPK